MSAKNGRDIARPMTAIAVALVAAVAATVSYIHIQSVAIRYGQPELAACLLPLSIDGTVAASWAAMQRGATTTGQAPGLARTMLISAVLATLACNAAYGAAHGWIGVFVSAWPAVAFAGSAEVAISVARREVVATEKTITRTAEVRRVSSPARRKRRRSRDPLAASRAVFAPGMTGAQLAEKLGIPPRTARRHVAALAQEA